jgi:serine/threonine protein phosphatase PrpC
MSSDEEQQPRIRQRHAMLTDIGVIREHNEDAAYADPEGGFFIVADGMGGHAAGEVASSMAVEAVRHALEAAREEIMEFARGPNEEGRRQLVSALENAVRQAHQAVYERGAKETDKQGMGTTLDVVLVAGAEAFVAHVGDSRTYLVRDGRAAQITTDHTVAEVLVIEGKLSAEEAQISPLRTILVNAIGVAPDVGVEMAHVKLKRGDKLLLCSDGMHDYFPQEQEVSEYVGGHEPTQALALLTDLAKNRGGHDNITGILLEVLDVPDDSETSEDGAFEGEDTRQVGLADTGAMPALHEGIPDEIARDDTMPVDERPTATTLPPPAGMAPYAQAEKPAPAPEGPVEDEADSRDTQRIKPMKLSAAKGPQGKSIGRQRKQPSSQSDSPEDEDTLEAAQKPEDADADAGADADASRSSE